MALDPIAYILIGAMVKEMVAAIWKFYTERSLKKYNIRDDLVKWFSDRFYDLFIKFRELEVRIKGRGVDGSGDVLSQIVECVHSINTKMVHKNYLHIKNNDRKVIDVSITKIAEVVHRIRNQKNNLLQSEFDLIDIKFLRYMLYINIIKLDTKGFKQYYNTIVFNIKSIRSKFICFAKRVCWKKEYLEKDGVLKKIAADKKWEKLVKNLCNA